MSRRLAKKAFRLASAFFCRVETPGNAGHRQWQVSTQERFDTAEKFSHSGATPKPEVIIRRNQSRDELAALTGNLPAETQSRCGANHVNELSRLYIRVRAIWRRAFALAHRIPPRHFYILVRRSSLIGCRSRLSFLPPSPAEGQPKYRYFLLARFFKKCHYYGREGIAPEYVWGRDAPV
ncbi:MAG: hypothetical protein P4M15_02720 [Alphaproteobacteria bacterium]|nr:hypothetical protein [Alphaproteobacteria bacterium]